MLDFFLNVFYGIVMIVSVWSFSDDGNKNLLDGCCVAYVVNMFFRVKVSSQVELGSMPRCVACPE